MPKRLVLGFLLIALLALGYGGLCDRPSESTIAGSSAPIPSAVSSLRAGANYTTIALNWQDNSNNETGFKIERSADGVTFAQIATVAADTIAYSDTGLTPATTYYYRVRAYNSNGDSMYSNSTSATTAPLPSAPTNLTASAVSASQINLTWDDNSTDETGFKLEWSTDGTNFTPPIMVNSNTNSYNHTGLDDGTVHYYRIRAYSPGGDSPYSNIASISTHLAPPSAFNITVISSAQINLSWTDNSGREDGFKIERSASLTTNTPLSYVEIATVNPNVVNYSDTNVIDGMTYFYRLRVYNSTLGNFYANESYATTPLNPPSTLNTTVISSSQIDLAWTDNSNNEAGFTIARKTGSGGSYAIIATVGTNVTTYSNTGLVDGVTYYYRVRTYTEIGIESVYSNEASPVIPLNAPTALTATVVSSSQINLTWIDNSGNEDGFKIERSLDGITFTQITTVLANVISYPDNGLIINTTYYYRVRAYNTGGDSAYSNEASTAILLNAPTNLTATAVSSSQIDLTWTDNSNNEDGFKIERKTGAGGTYTQIATVSANVTSYLDTGLPENTTYYYCVRAYSTGGNSSYSNAPYLTTVPNAPSSLNATVISATAITLTWADNSNAEDGFKIERKTGAGGTYTQITVVGANVISYTDTGLNRDTIYYYRVHAYNTAGDSPYSNEVSALTDIWILQSPATKPPARWCHAMAYDFARGVTVLFGGSDRTYGTFKDDTWEWDGTNWTLKSPTTKPSARYRYAMAYDSARHKTVLFGGTSGGDETWEWDGTDWTLKSPTTKPSARAYHSMAYDSVRGVTVLFGGWDGSNSKDDTWEWDGTDWTPKLPSNKPSVRGFTAMAYDSARGVTVLFGGSDLGVFGSYKDETWEWDGTNWTLKSLATKPSARDGHALVYDSARGVTVLFGGWSWNNDTYEWDGINWTPKSPVNKPSARAYHAMVYDSARGKVILFGGLDSTGQNGNCTDDTWEY